MKNICICGGCKAIISGKDHSKIDSHFNVFDYSARSSDNNSNYRYRHIGNLDQSGCIIFSLDLIDNDILLELWQPITKPVYNTRIVLITSIKNHQPLYSRTIIELDKDKMIDFLDSIIKKIDYSNLLG